MLAIGVPAAERVLHSAVSPAGPPLYSYHGTRGPFSGRQDGDRWIVGPSTGTFAPGDAVVWEAWTDIPADVIVSANFDLMCGDRPLGGFDFRTSPDHPRTPGWMAVGMMLPSDTPLGACDIAREAEFRRDAGRFERVTFPPIRFTVRGAS